MNNIPTAHVILGIDDDAKAGEAAFMAFDRGRRGGANPSVSDWYMDSANKQHVILSTLDESDIVKFSTSFNLTETQDQSLFIFEVMDPNNTFERNYFKRFYSGIAKYSTFVEGYLAKAKSGFIDWIGNQADFMKPDSRGKPRFRGYTQAFEQGLGGLREAAATGEAEAFNQEVLGDIVEEVWQSPHLQSLFVTFGVGNDMSTWAPVQRCQLVSLHYSLTDEGVKKYTIKFVANAGLLAFGESPETEKYLTATGRTENRVTLPFIYIDSKKHLTKKQREDRIAGGNPVSWRANNPVKMVSGMVKGMLSTILKDPPFFILEDWERVLEAKWTQLTVNYFKQKTDVLRGTKLLVDSLEGNNLFDVDQFAIQLARRITYVDDAPLGYLAADPAKAPLLGLGDPAAIARIEDLEKLGYVYDRSSAPNITRAHLESMSREYRKRQERAGITEGTVTSEQALENRTWFESRSYGVGGSRPGWEVPGATIFPATGGKTMTRTGLYIIPPHYEGGLLQKGEYRQLKAGSVLPPYLAQWLDTLMETTDRNFFEANLSPDTTLRALQDQAAENINAEYINLNYVTLPDKELYAIYLAVGTTFFELIGMSISHPIRVAAHMMGAPDIYGPIMDPRTFKFGNADLQPISVHWKKDGVKETANALQRIIKKLNIEEKDELMILAFSELSLVDRFRKNDDILSMLSEDVWGGIVPRARYKSLDTIILVSSVRIVTSLVNATPIPKLLHTNEQYKLLTRLFKDFKKDEPLPISSSEGGWSFSPLFSNPDVDTTQVPSQYPGEESFLSVFSNLKGLRDQTGKEGPFTEEEFKAILAEFRIPVFNYGLKNSNVRSCDFDLNPWYGYFLDIVPTTILTGLISSALKNEPAVQKIQEFYNDLDGDPAQSVKRAIDDFWKENIEESIPNVETIRGAIATASPISLTGAQKIFKDYIHTVTGDIASILSVNALGALSLASAEGLPDFKKTITDYLRITLGAPSIASKLVVNPDMQSESLEKILLIRQKLETRTFTGTLNTLPIFSIISPAKTITSRALLYFVEPEFTLAPIEKNSRYRSTWLSGEYYIVGYEVEFTTDDIRTRFNVVKNPSKAQGIGA